MYVLVYVCIYVYVNIYVCVCVCMYVCMYVCMHTCIHTHKQYFVIYVLRLRIRIFVIRYIVTMRCKEFPSGNILRIFKLFPLLAIV